MAPHTVNPHPSDTHDQHGQPHPPYRPALGCLVVVVWCYLAGGVCTGLFCVVVLGWGTNDLAALAAVVLAWPLFVFTAIVFAAAAMGAP